MRTIRPSSALRDFLSSEAAGGLVLMGAAALALVVANLPATASLYHDLVHAETGPVLTPKLGPMTVHLWINDGLMALFFLVIGLEIKRELVDGRLSSWEKRRLPVLAAAAGMVVPAAIFLAIVVDAPYLRAGWAIPAATDIAFAIGVLALLGKRAPASLKLFLTTVAIVDDMGAVAIIALAYTADLDSLALGAAALVFAAMWACNRSGVRHLGIYAVLSFALWYAVLLSGVHATIAGVLAATQIPIVRTPATPDAAHSPLHRLEHLLHPWVAFLIVPLFGFANAGVDLRAMGAEQLLGALPLAIAVGLFVGKQAGIFAAVWLAVRLGIARRPAGASWLQVYAVSVLCGVGFTMSLFIGGLAFPGRAELVEEVRLGVLMGSFASALLGYAILRIAPQRSNA